MRGSEGVAAYHGARWSLSWKMRLDSECGCPNGASLHAQLLYTISHMEVCFSQQRSVLENGSQIVLRKQP